MLRKFKQDSSLWLWKAFYCFSIACFMLALYWGAAGHPLRSDFSFALSLLLLIAGASVFLFDRQADSSYAMQLILCYTPFSLLWILALFSGYTNKGQTVFIVLGVLAFVVPLIVLLIVKIFRLNFSSVFKKAKQHFAIICLLLVFFLLSLDVFPQLAICDSYLYFEDSFNAMANWNFTISDANVLKLCSHQSFGVTLWYLIGSFFTPMDPAGLRLVNIILTSSAIICFYAIVLRLHLFQKRIYTISAIATGIFACNPLILGQVFELNLDIPSMAFYVWLLASFMYRKNILVVFSAFLLVFSKELGVVLLFGFCFGLLVALCYKAIRKQASFGQSLREFRVLAIGSITAAGSFAVMYLFTSRWMSGSEAAQRQVDAGFHTFGISRDNIFMKLKELYILNFSWVLLLVILISSVLIVYVLWRRGLLLTPKKLKRGKHIKDNKLFLDQTKLYDNLPTEGLSCIIVFPVLGSYLAFLLFSFFYITYLNPRYVTPHLLTITLACIVVLAYCARRRQKIFVSIAGFLCAILLVQNFYTCDPLTLRYFKNINIGETSIISTRTFYQDGNTRSTDSYLVSSRELLHGASYNRQYSYLSSAVMTLLEDIDYDSDTLIVLDPIYDKRGTYLTFLGKWYMDEDVYYYDKQNKRIRQMGDFERLNVSVATPEKKIELENYSEYKKVYFMTADFRKEFQTCIPIEGMQVLEKGTTTYNLWALDYYRLK